MAFKMKRTPIKGLGNFFSSLGKKATSDRQTKQKASNTGEYAGMTNFEKRRAEKKSRKPGESKFQADVRRGREARKTKTTKTQAVVPEAVVTVGGGKSGDGGKGYSSMKGDKRYTYKKNTETGGYDFIDSKTNKKGTIKPTNKKAMDKLNSAFTMKKK